MIFFFLNIYVECEEVKRSTTTFIWVPQNDFGTGAGFAVAGVADEVDSAN